MAPPLDRFKSLHALSSVMLSSHFAIVAVINLNNSNDCSRLDWNLAWQLLDKHLARLLYELVNLQFNLRVDHYFRSLSSWTGKARRGAKQPAN